MTDVEKLYSTLEVAAMLHIGVDTLRMKIRSGQISCRKIGPRKYWFSVADVNKYLQDAGQRQQLATSTFRLPPTRRKHERCAFCCSAFSVCAPARTVHYVNVSAAHPCSGTLTANTARPTKPTVVQTT